jgi:hypothetical protein
LRANYLYLSDFGEFRSPSFTVFGVKSIQPFKLVSINLLLMYNMTWRRTYGLLYLCACSSTYLGTK